MILLDASVRILVVAALAALVLWLLRVRSSALRHRVWTIVLVAMLFMPVLPALVPAIGLTLPARATAILPAPWVIPQVRIEPLPVSEIRIDAGGRAKPLAVTDVPPQPARVLPASPGNLVPPVLLGVYLAGIVVLLLRLAIGFRAARRLIRGASRLAMPADVPIFASPLVAAPLTVGVFNPAILLPSSWPGWSGEKLRACLAHEAAHARRRDPLVSFVARLNRCLFWFHPLAWWLDRTLAAAAEHAADDEAVRAVGHRRRYAEVLLDMAEAVRLRGGRVAWHGVGADGAGELGRRIDRVLHGAIGGDVSRTYAALVSALCVTTVVLVVACRREAAPQPLQPNAEVAERLEQQKRSAALLEKAKALRPSEVDAMEASLKRTPTDLETLRTLKLFYQTSGHTVLGWNEMVARRRPHILWLIETHPDHELALWRVSPTADPLTYAEAKKRWLAQAERPDASDKVLNHAAYFLQQADPQLAVPVLMRMKDFTARARRLGELYASVIKGPTSPRDGSPLTAFDADPYARQVRQTLEASDDAVLLAAAGHPLATTYRDDTRRELGRRLLARAVQIDPQQHAAARMLTAMEHDERAAAILERISARAAEIAGIARSPRLSADDRRKLYDAEVQAVAELPETDRFTILRELADRTYMLGETFEWNKDKASADAAFARSKKYARDALELAARLRDDPYYGAVVYRATVAMAVHALRDGDTERAVRLMRDATSVPASRGLEAHLFALDTRLMNYLLDRGERERVAEFLEQSAELRPGDRDRLLKDAAAIRAGQMPASYQRMVSFR